MKLLSNRAGYLYHTPTGYDCFVPTPLNDITFEIDNEMTLLVSDASGLLAKLDGMSSILPDRDVFISMYVQKEAVISSQIEGTQASLTDVLQKTKTNNDNRADTEEIVNYVHALNYGIRLLNDLPISTRYLKSIHTELLKGIRGNNKNPGEIRTSQNWIGPIGCDLSNATYVPPSYELMIEALSDLDKYMNTESFLPGLIKIALIHYQFETIHPFLDGNGRVGRLLIPLWLKENKLLEHPLLYLSLYFKQNRTEYYDLLMDVRFKGHYEAWIKFFLRGIITVANNAYKAIEEIEIIRKESLALIDKISNRSKEKYYVTLSYIFSHPYFDSGDLISYLHVSKPTALKIISDLFALKIITKTSNKERYVTYKFDKYVDVLEKGTEL